MLFEGGKQTTPTLNNAFLILAETSEYAKFKAVELSIEWVLWI